MFWPGVVDQANLDAKPINALPAAGVLLALALTAWARLFRPRARVRLLAAAGVLLLFLLALPWIAAELGFYLDGVPLLGRIFLTGEPYQGLPAVHHGHHHGMDGVLLASAALATVPLVRAMRVRPLRFAVALYVALELTYGLANAANDAWLEQVVKRGWAASQIPSVLTPSLSFAWLGIVLAALVLWPLVFSGRGAARAAGRFEALAGSPARGRPASRRP